jgi:hypothetical protein
MHEYYHPYELLLYINISRRPCRIFFNINEITKLAKINSIVFELEAIKFLGKNNLTN